MLEIKGLSFIWSPCLENTAVSDGAEGRMSRSDKIRLCPGFSTSLSSGAVARLFPLDGEL